MRDENVIKKEKEILFNFHEKVKQNKFQLLFAVRPLIEVPNQLVGAPMGKDVQLSCKVEASPKPINYWTRENGKYYILLTHAYIHRHLSRPNIYVRLVSM